MSGYTERAKIHSMTVNLGSFIYAGSRKSTKNQNYKIKNEVWYI